MTGVSNWWLILGLFFGNFRASWMKPWLNPSSVFGISHLFTYWITFCSFLDDSPISITKFRQGGSFNWISAKARHVFPEVIAACASPCVPVWGGAVAVRDAGHVRWFPASKIHLPASTGAASRLYYTFQQSILAMKTLTEVDLLPTFNSKTCSSLRHFSFNGTFAGLPCRPRLPNPAETAQAVFEYISHLGGSRTLHSPVKLITNPVSYLHGRCTGFVFFGSHPFCTSYPLREGM